MNIKFNVLTDTATLVVFDLQSLKHRISDTPDWWSIEDDEIDEVNNGNAIFFNLDSDGDYLINIVDDLKEYTGIVYMHSPSGCLFIGAGEDTTGGGLEPDDINYISGSFINLPPGSYGVKFKRDGVNVSLSFFSSTENKNNIKEFIRL
ncbi:hypothetical protein JHU04_001797 [Brenneria sp. 4F2]|nr:hypothetical protein [Brenneria bubanii]